MKKLIINNTEYKLFGRLNGKEISVRREIELNPYCWDSEFIAVKMSWRRFKRVIKTKEVL